MSKELKQLVKLQETMTDVKKKWYATNAFYTSLIAILLIGLCWYGYKSYAIRSVNHQLIEELSADQYLNPYHLKSEVHSFGKLDIKGIIPHYSLLKRIEKINQKDTFQHIKFNLSSLEVLHSKKLEDYNQIILNKLHQEIHKLPYYYKIRLNLSEYGVLEVNGFRERGSTLISALGDFGLTDMNDKSIELPPSDSMVFSYEPNKFEVNDGIKQKLGLLDGFFKKNKILDLTFFVFSNPAGTMNLEEYYPKQRAQKLTEAMKSLNSNYKIKIKYNLESPLNSTSTDQLKKNRSVLVLPTKKGST